MPGADPRLPHFSCPTVARYHRCQVRHNDPVRTIALEEHFWTAEMAAPPGTGPLAAWGPKVGDQLSDLGALRLADMDANGIDLQVISHVAPAAQGRAGPEGLARARRANDQLAAGGGAPPDR